MVGRHSSMQLWAAEDGAAARAKKMNWTPATEYLNAGAVISATLTLVAGEVRWGGLRLGYVWMPLTTTLILLVAATAAGAGARYQWGIVTGLLCSLAGDVLLMLPHDLFVPGLSAFLLAHVCYLVAFTADNRLAAKPAPFLFWAGIGASLLGVLWPRIPITLRWPVVAYAVVLLGMAAQAASRALDLKSPAARAASVGAALFVVSDGLLAWKKFGGVLPASRLLILGTYFTAQWLIASSVRARCSNSPREI